MMRNDPVDDKFALFRQQASIIARKKEAAAETLSDAKDELQQCQQELGEKREAAKGLEGDEVLKGDEVCMTSSTVQGKNAVCVNIKHNRYFHSTSNSSIISF